MAQQLLDPAAQQRPVTLFYIEMAPEVEQGYLANLTTDPFGLNQPMGVVVLARAGVAGLCASNVHVRKLPQSGNAGKGAGEIIWHYTTKFRFGKQKINGLRAL